MKFNFKKLTIAIIILTIITFTGLKITKRFLYHPYNVERFGTFDKNKDFVIVFHGIYGKAKTLNAITDTLEKEGYSGINIQYPTTEDTVVPELVKQFGYKSVMEVPRIEKITLNMGVGEAVADKKVMEHAISDLEKIAGQKPVVTVARKSIAGFKIRDNYPVGCKVTLRRDQMFEFLDRLITIALPRVRDFRGVSGKSFDGRGNYNMGVREQIIFPEIEYDKIDALRGLNITITTTAKTDEEAKALLSLFKFPFKG